MKLTYLNLSLKIKRIGLNVKCKIISQFQLSNYTLSSTLRMFTSLNKRTKMTVTWEDATNIFSCAINLNNISD
jgi:hypothetical protein